MRQIVSAAALAAALSYGCGEQPPERVLTASKGHLTVYDAVATASAAPDVSSVYFTIVNAATLPDTLFEIGTAAGTAANYSARLVSSRAQ